MELGHHGKHVDTSARVVEELSDNDVHQVQQVQGKKYDPAPDMRDMHRLGKSQELKVS